MTPVKQARDAIARFNDSPLGVVDGLRQMMYQLDVYNRGAPIATAPITYPTGRWRSLGLKLRTLQGREGCYWLEVDWSRHGPPVPFLPSPFDLEATGNAQWPYWYRTQVDERWAWVLLHSSQILPLLPSWSGQPGVGTSPVYICLGFLGEHILAIDERYEKLIDAPGDIVAIGGVQQNAQQIKTRIESGADAGAAQGLHDGWTLIASPNAVDIATHSFRQWDHVAFKDRREYFEDILALAFGEPLSAVVQRGGIGYGVQGETAADNVADGGVWAILQAVGVAFANIYPRVTVTVTKTNDRARKLATEIFQSFAEGVSHLPDATLTRDELRALIDRDITTIPLVAGDAVQVDPAQATNAEDNAQIDKAEETEDAMSAHIAHLLADARDLGCNLAQTPPDLHPNSSGAGPTTHDAGLSTQKGSHP